MSSYATTFFRDMINKDVWLNCLLKSIENQLIVVDDMRFANEYITFDYTVNVARPGSGEHSRTPNSEGRLDGRPFTYTIVNDDTLYDLKQATIDVILDIIL